MSFHDSQQNRNKRKINSKTVEIKTTGYWMMFNFRLSANIVLWEYVAFVW